MFGFGRRSNYVSPILQAMQQQPSFVGPVQPQGMSQPPQVFSMPQMPNSVSSGPNIKQPMDPITQAMNQMTPGGTLNPNAFNAPGSINYGPVQPQGMSKQPQAPFALPQVPLSIQPQGGPSMGVISNPQPGYGSVRGSRRGRFG